MSDLKISELPALSGSDLASGDELAVVDSSASQTTKLTVNDLIANGVTLISDDTIPGAKILFAAGDIPGTALADGSVTTAKIAAGAVTGAKLADNSSVNLVTSLPTSGDFSGQLALDTDDNSLYAWDGSAWQTVAATSTIAGSTAGEINIVVTTSGTTTTISATIDDTASAAQFLAGPTGSAGTVGYRTIVSSDLPTATTTEKGAVVVNGNGLTLSGDTIAINNSVTSTSTHHVVTYDVNGLITGGRAITAADLPIATNAAVGGVIVSDGLTVDATGNLSIDNSVGAGTFTKVTVTDKGLVSAGTPLTAADLPNHSADLLTSGFINSSLIGNNSITGNKIANEATTKFGGAAGSDNVTIFPTGDFKGQFFWDETTQDLYVYTGSAWIAVSFLTGNLVNAGAYNASTNTMSSVTSAGSAAGFSAGSALPAPSQVNLNHYVVVDTSGTGTGAAPAVALAPPDMLLSQGVGSEYSLIDVSNAIAGQTASNISFIATGDIVATNVQSALQELDTEKLPKAGGTMTGNLELNNANVVFEGSSADDYETTLTVTNPTADRTITLPDVTGNVVTTGDSQTVTSSMILNGTILNQHINGSADIAVSKLASGSANQLLRTDADGITVGFASNIDIPGTLDVSSTATFDSTVVASGKLYANGRLVLLTGAPAVPSLYMSAGGGEDDDTGIYSPGANMFGISTAGTAAFTVNANQHVGIGTTTPVEKLTVFDDTSSYIYIQNTASGQTSTDGFSLGLIGSHAYISNRESGDTIFYNAGSERARLNSSGYFGLNTTAPQHLLSIEGASTTLGSASTLLNIGNKSFAANSYRLIGFGYTSSTEPPAFIGYQEIDASGNTYGDLVFGTRNVNTDTVPTERVRITAGGYLKAAHDGGYVGATGTWHELTGTTNNGYTLRATCDNASPGNHYLGEFKFSASSPNSESAKFLQCLDNAGARINLDSDGGIHNYQSNDGNLCDEREKKNIVSLESKWNKVKSWELKKFHYNEDADTDDLRYGVIAQQVEEHCPEVLCDWIKQRAEDAVLDGDGNVVTPAVSEVIRKGIKEQQMMWMAIKALQEAQDRIETLEQRLTDAGL